MTTTTKKVKQKAISHGKNLVTLKYKSVPQDLCYRRTLSLLKNSC